MVRWFGPSWHAPVNEPKREMSVPLGEHCIECGEAFDHGDRGVATPCSPSISENGQVFYHLRCFLRCVGVDAGPEVY